MIHFTPEGEHLKVGLNITVGRNNWWPYITFNWMWYDIATHTLSNKRLRIRTWRLKVFTSSDKSNVIESYLRFHELMAFPREFLEDLQLCYDMSEVERLFHQYKIYKRLDVWAQH